MPVLRASHLKFFGLAILVIFGNILNHFCQFTSCEECAHALAVLLIVRPLGNLDDTLGTVRSHSRAIVRLIVFVPQVWLAIAPQLHVG